MPLVPRGHIHKHSNETSAIWTLREKGHFSDALRSVVIRKVDCFQESLCKFEQTVMYMY